MKVKNAIAYFEDAVRESEEIIANCSPALQAELTKQKEHFAVALAALREQEQSQWISDRLPTEDECDRAIVGVVNGYNGRITFTDAEIFVCYDFKEKDWYSEDYDIEGCKVRCWMPLPEPPKEGAEG